MGIDISHLVLEALGHADDHVVDERSNCSESGDALADAMVEFDLDGVLFGFREGDGEVL